MVEKSFIYGVIIVVIFVAVVALFWYSFVMKQGGSFGPVWGNFSEKIKNLFNFGFH
jgi:hypothetical protein